MNKNKKNLDKVFNNSLSNVRQKEAVERFAERLQNEINKFDLVWVDFEGYRKAILRSEAIKQGLPFYERT